jgi:hypothetical protein
MRDFFLKERKNEKRNIAIFFVKSKKTERKRTQNCLQKPSFIDDKNNCEM